MFCVASKQEQPANNDLENQAADELANRIVDKIRSANRPIVIGDFYAQRFGFGEEIRGLCDALGIRYFGSECLISVSMRSDMEILIGGVIYPCSQSSQVSLPYQYQLRQRLGPWYRYLLCPALLYQSDAGRTEPAVRWDLFWKDDGPSCQVGSRDRGHVLDRRQDG
jgi:hypothetical protein